MTTLTTAVSERNGIKRIAQAGLTAKGIVYLLLGAIAFMAAFEMGGQSAENTDKSAVLNILKESSAGKWILPLLAIGLLCYSTWRMVQVYHAAKDEGRKKWKGLRYFLSSVIYFSVAVSAFRMLFSSGKNNGDNQQQFASELLSKPGGEWLLGITALIIAGTGFYQVYYGLSEKYKKHVQKLNLHGKASSLLLTSGKVGYVARGIVWLVIAFLTLKAAIHASSAEAGDTGKAFSFLENSPFGSYILAALGVGLMAYGLFNFIRVRYEELEGT